MPNLDPKIGVINTFRTQRTEIQFALGEFVDNSIDSYFKNKEDLKKINPSFKPFIDIVFDSDENFITIEDNCAGISKEDEERAFNIGITNPNETDIGTYGMGMKVSSFWFSPKWKLETKAINEKEEKTFKVDIKKIVEAGKTEDSSINSDADPFTRITLNEVYKGRLPADTRKLNNIQKYLYEMYRFMILKKSITIRFNGKPLKQDIPEIFVKRYIHEKDGDEKEWLTKLPPFDLGTVERKGKTINLSTLGGSAYIKDKGSNKDQKGFSLFWKDRLVDGHAQKPWMPSTINYEEEELQIYGANNQYVAQRLEGYIMLSPEFQVPSTKDGVDWEGTEELLIRKLKLYLQSATLVGEENGKGYDFIEQCKKLADFNKGDDEDQDDDSGLGVDVGPNDPPAPPIFVPEGDDEDSDEGNEPDQIFELEGTETLSITYQATTWKITIKVIRKENEKFYSVIEGPHGIKGDEEREIGLKINLSDPFIRTHFYQENLKEQKQGVIRFCIALALAEAISAELPSNRAQSVRLRFLEIIKIFSEDS